MFTKPAPALPPLKNQPRSEYMAELVTHLTEVHEALRPLQTEVWQKDQEEPMLARYICRIWV